MQHRLALASLLLFAACAPKSADSDDPTGSSAVDTDGAEATSATDTPTTGADPTAPQMSAGTAPDPGTSTSAGTTTAGTGATSTSTTTGDETGDETGGGLPGACEAVCEHWDTCKPGIVGPIPRCVGGCVADFGDEPGCAAAIAAQWACVAGLSCEEALKFIESSPTSCLREVEAADAACSQLNCGGEVGGGDTTCEFQRQCGDVTQSFVCDEEVCTCEQEGTPDKECPNDGFCSLDATDQRAAINACCGWDWDIPAG